MNLQEARKIVFEAKPVFADLYFKYQDKKWPDYTEENYPKNFTPNINLPELLEAMRSILSPLLGTDRAESAVKKVLKTGFVSTADHSGILCHPFFSNSNLVRSENIERTDSIVSFTCGGVSLTNSSYPRGIFFHDKNLKEVKIPFVSLAGRRRSVYGLPPFSKKRIEQILSQIKNLNISKDALYQLQVLFEGTMNTPEIFEAKTYSEQLIILNNHNWYQIFGNDRGNFVYVEVEQIVRQLLLDIHLNNQTFINKILFEKTTRDSYIEHFEKIVGAHNTKNQSGSHIFWFIDNDKNTRVQLFLVDKRLQSKDQKIKIELDPETLRNHLESYTLLPSMAFCYGILAGYYGLTLSGGFSQIQYLGDILNAWKKTALDAGEKTENPRTDIFSGEFTLVGITKEEQTIPASLIDIMLYGTDPEKDLTHSPTGGVVRAIHEQTIGETIDAMMDEFVEIITGVKPKITNIKIHKTFNV